MNDDVDVLPVELEATFVHRARTERAEAPVVILPIKEVDGVGIYPQDTLFLAKTLRAAGIHAAYLHDSEHRRFVVRNSAIAVVGAVLLGIASSAGWDGIKALFRGRSSSLVDVTYVDLETDDGRLKAWRASGDADAVLRVIDSLRSEDLNISVKDGPEPAVARSPARAFAMAGTDDDLRSDYVRGQITQRRKTGDEMLADSKAALASDPPDRSAAERIARGALQMYARSLDWAEDTPAEEDAHSTMDAAGRWVRRTFGCWLDRDGTTYSETCPVALAHNRLGFSVGGSAKRVCSLCDDDLSECEHLPGTAYMVPGGSGLLGWCRVCLQPECEHSPEELYRASVVSTIQQMDVDEISLVTKPKQPEARIFKMSVSTADLQSALGDEFVPGMEVSCEKCITDWKGLR